MKSISQDKRRFIERIDRERRLFEEGMRGWVGILLSKGPREGKKANSNNRPFAWVNSPIPEAHFTIRAFPPKLPDFLLLPPGAATSPPPAGRFPEPVRNLPTMGSSSADGARIPPSRAGSRLCVRCGERKAALKRPKTLEQVSPVRPPRLRCNFCDVLGSSSAGANTVDVVNLVGSEGLLCFANFGVGGAQGFKASRVVGLLLDLVMCNTWQPKFV